MRKIFVLDTNILLHSAESIESFDDNEVIIPIEVLEELDNFKTHNDELGRMARRVIRRLDELRVLGPLGDGVKLNDQGGTLKITMSPELKKDIGLNKSVVDNRILLTAYQEQADNPKREVIFVSKDINARLKADAIGLKAQDFEREKVNFEELYTGYREIEIAGDKIDLFYEDKELELPDGNLLPHEFILMRDEGNPKHTALCKASSRTGVTHLNGDYEKAYGVKPRSKEQRMAMEILLDPKVPLVSLVGQAGTGKTLLALACGLEHVMDGVYYDRILVGRPIIPFGNDIGYLPGDKEEKMNPWMQPIYDNLTYLMKNKSVKSVKGGRGRNSKSSDKESDANEEKRAQEEVNSLFEDHRVEVEALTYIRGRSIPRQFVIIDEAQNLTPHEVKTIVSRAGEGTKIVLTGDPYQIDNPYLDCSSNGLIYAAERMKESSLHAHIALRRSERSPLAGEAADLL